MTWCVAASGVLMFSFRDTLVTLDIVGSPRRGQRYRFEKGLSEASHEGSL